MEVDILQFFISITGILVLYMDSTSCFPIVSGSSLTCFVSRVLVISSFLSDEESVYTLLSPSIPLRRRTEIYAPEVPGTYLVYFMYRERDVSGSEPLRAR